MDYAIMDEPELLALHRSTRLLRAVANRARWRQAMRRRCTRLSKILADLEGAIPFFRRTKNDGVWTFASENGPVLALVIHPPGNALADLDQPFIVTVHQPEQVDRGVDVLVDQGLIILREKP